VNYQHKLRNYQATMKDRINNNDAKSEHTPDPVRSC